jgi:calcineurin-like phosphoesterase
MNNLMNEIKSKNIDFVIVNGENAASQGVGLTKEICHDFFNCGVDVITTGNHVWDQKEIMEYIDKEERLLRPKNLLNQHQVGVSIFITLKMILKLVYLI